MMGPEGRVERAVAEVAMGEEGVERMAEIWTLMVREEVIWSEVLEL